MLNSQVLAMIQARTAQFLKETCTIEVEQDAVGDFGNPAPAWTVVATNVACRVITSRPMTHPTAEMVGSQEQLVEEYRIICPYGTALAPNQRITLSTGEVYTVVSVITNRTDETDTQAVMTRARGQ